MDHIKNIFIKKMNIIKELLISGKDAQEELSHFKKSADVIAQMRQQNIREFLRSLSLDLEVFYIQNREKKTK